MKRRLLAISTVCLIAAGAGAAALHFAPSTSLFGHAARVLSSHDGPRTTSTGDKTVAPLSREGWQPGVGYAQTIDFKVGVGTNEKEEAGSGQQFALRLGGKLETRV